jgi:hypothetical protein
MFDFISSPYFIIFAPVGLLAAFLIYQKVQELRASLDENRFRIILVDSDQSLMGTYAHKIVEGKNTYFDIENVRYRFPTDHKKVYRVGKLRIPTVYYHRGVTSDAIALAHKQEVADKQSDKDYKAALENKSINLLIDAFRATFLDPQTSFIIIIGAIILGNGAVYYTLNQKIEQLIAIMGG